MLRGTLLRMLLKPAVETDYTAIIDLANVAYRGTGPVASWNVEQGILEGQRMNESLLREELATKPAGFLLTLKDEAGGTLLGTVRLDPVLLESKSDGVPDGVWHLGH